jgi:hypothetical protein
MTPWRYPIISQYILDACIVSQAVHLVFSAFIAVPSDPQFVAMRIKVGSSSEAE